MNLRNNSIRYAALMLSINCLLAFGACQRQPAQFNAPIGESTDILSNAPAGENSDISSTADSSFLSSQAPESEAAPSTKEPPVSSQAASTASQPVASEMSQPETPTISFTIGERGIFWKNPDPTQASNVKIVIIRSMAELQNLFEKENGYSAPENYGKYDDAFFEEHAIVFVGQQLSSCTMQRRINHLTRSGNQLIVDYSTQIPSLCDGAVAIWQKLLEVSKGDVEGVTETTARNHEIRLTEGEDYDESEWEQ